MELTAHLSALMSMKLLNFYLSSEQNIFFNPSNA